MTKQELKEKLIAIKKGGFITPLLEELWNAHKPLDMPFEAESEWLYIKKIEELKQEIKGLQAQKLSVDEAKKKAE